MQHIAARSDHPDSTKNISKTSNRLRVQLDFSEDAFDRLEDLRKETDAISKADVIRNALRVYEWLAEQSRAGRFIAVQDEDEHQISRIEAKWFLR